MTKLKIDPEDSNFVEKMYEQNAKFKDYVNKAVRSGADKDRILKTKLTHAVCMYYYYDAN